MSFKRFPFVPYAGGTGSPSLEVELVGVNGEAVTSLALVDTGAEWSGLPWDLALRLGADPSMFHQQQHGTGAGKVPGHWWHSSPEGSLRDEPVVRVMGHEVKIAPTVSRRLDIVVLGRIDFLSYFRLTVDQRARDFTLEAYPEPFEAWKTRIGDWASYF
jgi:hypothetical protein